MMSLSLAIVLLMLAAWHWRRGALKSARIFVVGAALNALIGLVFYVFSS